MRPQLIYTADPSGLGRLRRGLAVAAHLPGPVAVIGNGDVHRFGWPWVYGLPGHPLVERVEALRRIADEVNPGLLIVDCEPAGWMGELVLSGLLGRCPAVLLMRDVYGDRDAIWRRWKEHGAFPALERFRAVWVAGVPAMGDPLEGIPLPEMPREFIGYPWHPPGEPQIEARGKVLVTVGGGRDGADLIRAALKLPNVVAVSGPHGPEIEGAVRFEPVLHTSIAEADGVVAMAGAGTFADILAARARALLVPRLGPGIEQQERASRAAALGMVDVLNGDLAAGVAAMLERPRPVTDGWLMEPKRLRRLAVEAMQ